MIVSAEAKSDLAQFVEHLLEERRASIRAVALYMDVSDRTIRRMLDGETPDPETLRKLANYANYPVKELFRMVGWLDEEEELKSEMLAEVEHLMRQLPEESQRRIRDMARLEYEYTAKDQESNDEQEQTRTAS